MAVSTEFGARWLIPLLQEFMTLYPSIHLNLVLRDEEVDLAQREADMSIASQRSEHPDWVSTQLLQGKNRLYASRRYLERKGVPVKIADLDVHQLIVLDEEVPESLAKMNSILICGLKPGKTREPYLIINNVWGILQSVRSDLGMAILNRFIVKDEGDLVEILPEYDFGTFEKFIIYPQQLKTSKRIAAFQDFIMKKAHEAES